MQKAQSNFEQTSQKQHLFSEVLYAADTWGNERYCVRGDMGNRIKEQQLVVYADRTRCHAW